MIPRSVLHTWGIVIEEPAEVRDVVVINMLVRVLSIGVRAGLVIVTLTGVVLDVLTAVTVGAGADMLTDVEIIAVGVKGIAFEFAVSLVGALIDTWAGLSFFVSVGIVLTALAIMRFRCTPLSFLTILECDRALQDRIPSYHVCLSFALPALPHVPNQEPPRPQQLALPDFPIVPHFGHAELIVVAAEIHMYTCTGQRRHKH